MAEDGGSPSERWVSPAWAWFCGWCWKVGRERVWALREVRRVQVPLRPRADCGRSCLDVQQRCLLVAVHEHRTCPGARDRLRGGHKRIGWQYRFITRAEADRTQRELQRVRAVGHAHAVPHPAERGVLLLERGHFWTADETCRAQDPLEAGAHLLVHLVARRGQIHQRDP